MQTPTEMRESEPAELDRSCPVAIIRGTGAGLNNRELIEHKHYESGRAEVDARDVPGSSSEPWINVVQAYEPVSMPACDYMLKTQMLRERVKGSVLDVGAGSCWLTAKVSLEASVDRVYALDMSEHFLRTVGTRMLRHLGADFSKVTFVASDFNEIPIDSGTIDCALLFGSLHHSRSPIKTLEEVARCVKRRGTIMILENPSAVVHIHGARRRALEWRNVTEICYTKGELEYIIANASIGRLEIVPLDILSGGGLKLAVRRVLRRLNLEAVLINPPSYLFIIEKD